MCGRYHLSRRKQLIQEYFNSTDEVDWEPRYNIAPSQNVGIIRQDGAKPERHFSTRALGPNPVLGEGPQHRLEANQGALGDGRQQGGGAQGAAEPLAGLMKRYPVSPHVTS